MKIQPGDQVPARDLVDIHGEKVAVPDTERLVHLQFRRFAGCPICHLHLRSFVNRNEEVAAAGVREVVLFHSSAEELRRTAAELPFAVVGDPEKALYREFGVEHAPRALLNPRALRAVVASVTEVLRGRLPRPPVAAEGGRLGLPGDFLVSPDGRVRAAKYGEHADDQWSVEDVLALARQHS
ncbi:peroxiredoxin-like family protein [Pseudonocardia eucalypti]|uniref:Peroxiredoxin-like family protein n=1 Tax=Pseudonocardia eucalypti TaxID=648755 RepID=A0ABP9Q8Q0_9PSEU|nr:peroxiredoxin [Pseudonocardia eucalypti]